MVAQNGSPEHDVLAHECKIDNISDVVDRSDGFRALDESNNAGEDSGEGGVIEDRFAVVEDAEEPVPCTVGVVRTLAVVELWHQDIAAARDDSAYVVELLLDESVLPLGAVCLSCVCLLRERIHRKTHLASA